jgi:iron complex transport system substrate-binding protein
MEKGNNNKLLKLSRRDFVQGSGAFLLLSLLGGCTTESITSTITSTQTATQINTSTVSNISTVTSTITSTAIVNKTETATVTETVTATESGTFTVIDNVGNECTIPTKIEKAVIVQVPLTATYCMYMGGNVEHLIGVSGSVLSTISKTVLPNIAPEILDVSTSFYDAAGQLNLEELIKLEPDIVLYNGHNTTHTEMFKTAGIPAAGFSTSGDPMVLYQSWLQLLEDIFQEEGKMSEVYAYANAKFESIQERIATVPEVDRPNAIIFWSIRDNAPTVTGETGHFGSFWLSNLGVNNVAKGVQGVASVTMEQIIAWDPDIIYMVGKGQSGNYTPQDLFNNNMGGVDFSVLRAVRERKVYSCDLGMWSWYTPNSDAPLVFQWLAKTAYPDLFEDLDVYQETFDYYKKFYNYELSDEQLDYIFTDSGIEK